MYKGGDGGRVCDHLVVDRGTIPVMKSPASFEWWRLVLTRPDYEAWH